MKEESVYVSVANVKPVEMVPGAWQRTLAWGERMLISHVTLEPGSLVPRHKHPHEQVGFVIEGEITMVIGGESHAFKAGDSYVIPSNVEHDGRVTQHTVVLDVFSPPREDFKRQSP